MTTTQTHRDRIARLGMVGLVDEETINLAVAIGLEIRGGCINSLDHRVRIFVGNRFPGSHKSRYALRSRVVWWLHTGEVLTGCEFNIHHNNHDRADDRFSNLSKMPHREHAQQHNPKTVEWVDRLCLHCGGLFKIKKFRLREKTRGQFCGQACYQAHPKKPETRKKQGRTLRKMYREGWRPLEGGWQT